MTIRLPPLTDVVAERTYPVDGGGAVVVRIGRPFVEPDGTWFCPFEIRGPLTDRLSRAGGVDAVQCLLHAVYMLSTEVELCREVQDGRLSWDGQRVHFGLPGPETDPPYAPRG
jgi:hypothetical protein